jgi:hypothetical protein
MAELSDRFALPLLQPGQAQKELFHNEALIALENIVHVVAESIGEDAPPADAAPGQAWIVGLTPAGAWEGQAGRIAAMTQGGWRFVAPVTGMTAWLQDAGHWLWWDGSNWNRDTIPVPGISVGGVRVIGGQQPAIADPAGGTTIDDEARAAISALFAALRSHGLIAS